MKKALITGASSGIGREMAIILDNSGYELVLVARREDRLKELSNKIARKCKIAVCDVSDMESVNALFEDNQDIDVLINNAGFGVFGMLTATDADRENEMIDVNIRAVHFLTKKYAALFEKRGRGKILNVASSAAFFPGPMFSSYYASKAYVMRLSLALREELRRKKSGVTVSVLCPGPVRTEFNDVAGVNFGIGSLSAQKVAKIAIKGMLKGKAVIVPGFMIKCTRLFAKLVPECISTRIVYHMQKAKQK